MLVVADTRRLAGCGVSVSADMKILLVEDDETVREFIEHYLGDLGYTVFGAFSPSSAFEALDLLPNPDLLICDFNLGTERDGIDVAAEIVRRYPKVHVLIIAGRATAALQKLGQTLEGSVLPKPFFGPQLLEAIALEMQRPLQQRS